MIPAAFLRVHARLEFGGGRAPGRARSTTAGHVEPLFLEHVERLFDRRVFQKEPGRVPVRVAVVWIPALVERVAEHVAAQGHAAAYQYPGYLAEVDVGQPVPAEGERAAVADGDIAGPLFAEPLGEAVQSVVGRLQTEPLLFPEALGQRQLTVPQEVQHVPEQHAVPVDEVPALAVLGQRVQPAAEPVGQQRRLRLHQRGRSRRVEHAADVQVDHLVHRRARSVVLGNDDDDDDDFLGRGHESLLWSRDTRRVVNIINNTTRYYNRVQ